MTSKGFNEIFASNIHKPAFDSKLDQYAKDSDIFPVRNYIIKTFKKFPAIFHSDDTFDHRILDYLLENGQLITFSTNGKIKNLSQNLKGFRGGTFWFLYKEKNIIKIMVNNQDDGDDHFWDDDAVNKTSKKIFNMTVVTPCDSAVTELPFEDFVEFLAKKEGTKINLFVKNSYGDYSFEPLSVKLPDVNLELNYGKEFLPIYDIVKERLETKTSGLYMFHGPPGTGKSSFIKYLANVIKKDFIYIPTTMLETFTTDPACLQMLIGKNNSVLVLEDAEKLIMKRHGDSEDSSAVSSLLNLSDGILSDILNISVIMTYNCKTDKIDDALLRKGRLQTDYKFDLLSLENVKTLCKHLKYSDEIIDSIKGPMSLADIYNIQSETRFSKALTDNDEKRIGF